MHFLISQSAHENPLTHQYISLYACLRKQKIVDKILLYIFITIRDVTTGATGATEVAPKFSDTLTLSQPRGADSAHHYRGRS